MKHILALAFLFTGFSVFAQETEEQQKEPVFQVVETMPQFPGGKVELVKFLQKNMVYPEQDRKDGREGKVYLQFIVEKDGSVTEVTPIGKVYELATQAMVDESMRLVNLMPKFEPGLQRGKPVRVKYLLPISFKLN